MRERITFLHAANHPFDPQQLRVENDTLHVSSLVAAREDRLTFSLYELPQELWRVLKQCHEIHLRWVSSTRYPSIAPLVAGVSPGLHVFFTPQGSPSANFICPLLLKVFGINVRCISTEDSFTQLPKLSERFTSSTAFQYFGLVRSLDDLKIYIQHKVCPGLDETCISRATNLTNADYLDVDYDTISQSLVITAFWHRSFSTQGRWNEKIRKLGKSTKIEVGVLTNEKPIRPEELSLGGMLATVGENNPTRFSFPSRHHPSPESAGKAYLTSFPPPTGLHPTLRLTFPSTSMQPPSSGCALHTYLTLPSAFFLDKYQLSSPLFLASKNLRAIRSLSGETDLEAPNWVVFKWGLAMLMELAPPVTPTSQPIDSKSLDKSWNADIPLHLRYLPPTRGGVYNVSVPWPVVFWACAAEEGTKMNVNPFDRVNLGYDGLFGPRTMFYHLQPERTATGSLVVSAQVPVLDLDRARWVDVGTVSVVLLGFMWIMGKLAMAYWGDGQGVRQAHRKKE